MRLLTPMLNRVVYPVLGRSGYFRGRRSACVVTYHGVCADSYESPDPFLDNSLLTVKQFRSQLRLLKRYYKVISPEYFFDWLRKSHELPERAVLLTCDDGLLNNLSVMVPLLRDEGMQCLFFVTGQSAEDFAGVMLWYVELYLMILKAPEGRAFESHGIKIPTLPRDTSMRRKQWAQLLNQLSPLEACQRKQFLTEAAVHWNLARNWRDRYLENSALQQRFKLLSSSDLKSMVRAGMTVGAHTMTHPVLSAQPVQDARDEMTRCKGKLTLAAGQPVWALAYPFGNAASVGRREYQLAEEAGYQCAFMNVSGSLDEAVRFSLPRVHVTADMSLEIFEAHVSGFHESLRAKFQRLRNGGGIG